MVPHKDRKQIEQAIRDANDEKLNHQKEAETCGNRVRGLNNKIKNLNLQIVTIKNEDATDQPPDISALEDDVERRKKELEAISKGPWNSMSKCRRSRCYFKGR